MSVPFAYRRLARPVLAAALAGAMSLVSPAPLPAQVAEFYDVPYAPGQWNIGRRLNESTFRYCVDSRDPDWALAAEIADAIAAGLLLEPQRYVVEREVAVEDITKVYEVMLEHCEVHMGFKLIPGGLPDWVTVTRPYYESEYVFVTADPDVAALGDVAPGSPIGATLGTSAHIQLVSYVSTLEPQERWPVFPMGTNDLALDSLLNGTVDVALVWAPSLWAKQRGTPAFADVHVIDPTPLPPTRLGVGALLLSDETFLRATIDEVIAALVADGTIGAILEAHDFPAIVPRQ